MASTESEEYNQTPSTTETIQEETHDVESNVDEEETSELE